MKLEEIYNACEFTPNKDQNNAICTTEGPLLIIAGPGSGKTQVLIIRTLNLLLNHRVQPRNIMLCTFTEKAALQLKERLRFFVSKCGQDLDIADMAIGTIHSICNSLLRENITRTNLARNYEVLEDITQQLFLYERFNKIFPEKYNDRYLSRWISRWQTIKRSTDYFNKIVEERIELDVLEKNHDLFIRELAKAFARYREQLYESVRLDFAHLQSELLDLLEKDAEVRQELQNRFQYIMIDEYQDTNYIQERLMFTLAEPDNNLCVVGDEDQSLYRFRGATVRNILEFSAHFPHCTRVSLETNYRSHPRIIEVYNQFMDSGNWTGDGGRQYRFDKKIKPDPDKQFTDYPSVFTISLNETKGDANQVAEFVAYLKDNYIIHDLNQVAILLHSVRPEHSGRYIEALAAKGILSYAPRARRFFDNAEVIELVGAFTHILNFRDDERGMAYGRAGKELFDYCDHCLDHLDGICRGRHVGLANYLNEKAQEIAELGPTDTLEVGLLDIFYELMAYEPFFSYLTDEISARNLAIFSNLLTLFQQYYHHPIITGKALDWMKKKFFNSYLRFLLEGGVNEYEDPYDLFPSGRVQIMTIHQAKGLEFPVGIVGSLAAGFPWWSKRDIDVHLGKFYHRKEYEPLDRIGEFDGMRQFYVAFSRPKYILALTCPDEPRIPFQPVWSLLPKYEKISKEKWLMLDVEAPTPSSLKLEFSLTSHINVYDTCPRQYLMYREYEFAPARAAQVFFGTVVHGTIEDIHRHILERKSEPINNDLVESYFDNNFETLRKRGIHPLSKEQREKASSHVINYVQNNRHLFERLKETEVEIVVEKPDYYLTGRVDLIVGTDGKLELVDFKAQQRPESDDQTIENCRKQLAVYSHAIEEKYNERPERTIVYWTGEAALTKAWMPIDISQEDVIAAGKHFDEVVEKIRCKDFSIKQKPPSETCRNCDFRYNCRAS